MKATDANSRAPATNARSASVYLTRLWQIQSPPLMSATRRVFACLFPPPSPHPSLRILPHTVEEESWQYVSMLRPTLCAIINNSHRLNEGPNVVAQSRLLRGPHHQAPHASNAMKTRPFHRHLLLRPFPTQMTAWMSAMLYRTWMMNQRRGTRAMIFSPRSSKSECSITFPPFPEYWRSVVLWHYFAHIPVQRMSTRRDAIVESLSYSSCAA